VPVVKETIVHSFSGGPTDGATPLAGLVADSADNLYGTTYVGGIGCNGQGCGTVYKITPSGTETVLYSFTGGADGSNPYYADLVLDPAGNSTAPRWAVATSRAVPMGELAEWCSR
jgi:uncharacterized repeat protein (TIGR03803 family)